MQPRKSDNSTRSGESNRPLPAQLAQGLEPQTRLALMHGLRRRILRTLNQDRTPRSTQDLRTTFPRSSLSSVSYHVFVLGECGILTVSRVKAAPGSFTHLLTSNVAEDPQLVAVLRATESLDDVR